MKAVLSEEAYAEFRAQGFVRTGLTLPGEVLDSIHEEYGRMPASLSNWSYFESGAIAKPGDRGLRSRLVRLARSFWPRAQSSSSTPRIYEKSIYGSTSLIPLVLGNLLDQGLGSQLGEVSFLAAHDILLEGTKDDYNFGFHDDGFGWDIFFQTGDDVTIYIALQDMDESTGGRLPVELDPERSILFAERNRSIRAFAELCKEAGADLHEGRVTREGAETCRGRERIADVYHTMLAERKERTRQHYRKVAMSTIDMKKGEVILFNNKLFHDVETWNESTYRSIYIIRCLPLYEMGLCPPRNFLNDVACNRYLLDARAGRVHDLDLRIETPPFEVGPED